ncbi:MAG: geranylgeranylglycerol-phosphate geranylgeranyltransferase [Candidatus Zixiibacteriota bacterium]|nr:MAG: geranylgeranylglycerol-phosphate geranylgeranyltransferase [candidate division Zixibacteria bacterium]
MQKLLDMFILIRFVNCLLAMVGVVVGAMMTWLYPVYYGPMAAALAAFFVCAGGNVVNDITDIESDRINHPNRVLVRGSISVRSAMWLAAILNLLALMSAAAVNEEVLVVVSVAIALLLGYNLKLKRIVLAGNFTVAALAGLTFMTGGWSVDSTLITTLPGPLIPAVFAFFFHLVREIVKDVQDIEGDRRSGRQSLPILIGESRSLAVAMVLHLTLVILTLVPIWNRWFGRLYEILAVYVVALPLLALLILIWGKPSLRMLRIGSSALKVGMVLGLVALLAESFG